MPISSTALITFAGGAALAKGVPTPWLSLVRFGTAFFVESTIWYWNMFLIGMALIADHGRESGAPYAANSAFLGNEVKAPPRRESFALTLPRTSVCAAVS